MQTDAFGGKKVRVEGPNGRFTDAVLLDGRVLREVIAVGKHIGYDFGTDRKLHVHMGLYGDFAEGTGLAPEMRGALRLRISTKSDWLELRGPTDCSVWTDEQWEALRARLGPDPLNGDDPERGFETILGKKTTSIALLLMDQSVFSGIGNVFRAELLFRARVSPFRAGAQVKRDELKAIWKDAGKLMQDAMIDRRIVTTKPADRPHRKGPALDEEVNYVYRRKGKPCFVCGTKIETKVMAGRNLFWCPTCQAV
jgi:endonuclease-8